MVTKLIVLISLFGVCLAHDTTPEGDGGCDGDWQWSPFGKCHLFVTTERLTWNKAQTACLKLGGSLATIRNEREIIWIKGTRLHYGLDDGFWIGGYKKADKWYWMTETGSQPIYETDWTAGQPDNLTGIQDCLSLFYQDISPQLRWGDGNCDRLVNYICEKPHNVNAFG